MSAEVSKLLIGPRLDLNSIPSQLYVGCSISCGSSTLSVKLVLQTRHICEHFELISLSSKFHQDRFGSLVTTIFKVAKSPGIIKLTQKIFCEIIFYNFHPRLTQQQGLNELVFVFGDTYVFKFKSKQGTTAPLRHIGTFNPSKNSSNQWEQIWMPYRWL